MTSQPSENDARLFYTILMNQEGNPKVNWDAVAQQAGYKNGDSASARYRAIRRKFSSTSSHPQISPVKSDRVQKESGPLNPSPKKKTKLRAANKRKIDDEDDDDNIEAPEPKEEFSDAHD